MTQGRAAIYVRISDDREGEGLGIARQEKDCRDLAKRLGFEVVAFYPENDVGASDKTAKHKVRKQYAAMLDQARAGEFEYILAYSNSRLTRRVREYLELIELYKSNGVEIRTVVSGEHNLATADGRAVALTIAAWDAAEAERISERTKRANLQKALNGEPGLQHRRAFGFEHDGKTHRPAEAEAIREAVRSIIAGASITSIRRQWERDGVLTTDGKSSWGWTPVKRTLFGWKTAGVRSLNHEPLYDDSGALVMGNWEPIITLEERSAGLAMLERRTRRGVKEGKWLLSTLVRCGVCGGKLYGQLVDPVERSSYSCNSGKAATHLAINAKRLEAYVTTEVFEYVTARAYRGAIDVQPKQAVWSGEDELASVVGRIDELMETYSRGELSGAVVFPQVQKLEEKQSHLTRERDAFYAQTVLAPANRVEHAWTTSAALNSTQASFEEKQNAIRSEVEAVLIAKAEKGAPSRAPGALERRVDIVWKQPHPEVPRLTAEEWQGMTLTAESDPAMVDRLWQLFTEPADPTDVSCLGPEPDQSEMMTEDRSGTATAERGSARE
ncbi:recombinase family protein [Curtobacterium herbarum]|uniref:Recombinase family protein n=1 Tax=Curtobacterium herbarum TaxID=150122 RepID=A0ABP4K6N7_9MICO|nr:recombinase family protein [Curtobacterium herbarum]MBM7474890.1 DNA invertase Pin-like site-specific DNA recombinase [Curtobacterium herbarum]MCS6545537.1 recombinase family protein [Curtobacterium herbarum]